MLLPYDVVLKEGVAVGVEAIRPKLCSPELPGIGVGVEWRCEFRLTSVESCLTGCEDEDADADETARARPACVSRRRFGPSLTLGWVWHCYNGPISKRIVGGGEFLSMLERHEPCTHVGTKWSLSFCC